MHQSQKDSAPFPGEDYREFWQRSEYRNKQTADNIENLILQNMKLWSHSSDGNTSYLY